MFQLAEGQPVLGKEPEPWGRVWVDAEVEEKVIGYRKGPSWES